MLGDFIWYSVEFAFMISSIAYTLYTFGILKPLIVGKNQAPATVTESWHNANGFLKSATKTISDFQKALETNTAGEGAEKKTE